MFLNVIGEAKDLFATIVLWNGNENGFVKTAAHQFDLASGYEIAKASEIAGVMLFDPEQERAGEMNGDPNVRMLFEQSEEGFIGFLVAIFHDGVKVSGRLVGMDDEDEVEWSGLRHSS
jgi:hypothetical protein